MVSGSGAGSGGGSGERLSLEDCRCPVCLEIFMEPVTLPCTHTFCKGCFLESVDKATLCCPLCRKRVSTWARLHSRNNTLVNQTLWTQIQTSFPLQCQRRLSGQDAISDDDPGVSVCVPRVSQPGELRQEYEDQVTKLTEAKRVLDEEERRASEEYIQTLLQEEEQLQQEERRRREEDERLARMLSNQLNSEEKVPPVEVTPMKKKKEVSGGLIERFLCPHPSKSNSSDCSSASSFMANKENILVSQHPPELDYYGDSPDLHPVSEGAQLDPRTQLSGDRGPSSSKRKSSELEEDEEVSKRICRSLPSSSSSSSSSGPGLGASDLQAVSEWEMELQSRQQQEEEDRRLALLLQKELDQEEKQRATDRRKGSSDAYLLRQNRHPPRKSSSSPSSASSAKTASSSSRGSKQTTLTHIFSSLSS